MVDGGLILPHSTASMAATVIIVITSLSPFIINGCIGNEV